MKLKLIVESAEAITALNKTKLQDMQLAWDIADVADVIQKHLDRYNEKRNEILKRLGKADPENPNLFEVPAASLDAFNLEHDGILDVEVKIEVPKVLLSQLSGGDFSPSDLLGLRRAGFLVKDESPKDAPK